MHDLRHKADIMATSGEDNNWFWVYFTSVNNIAKCDICYTSFQITEVPNDDIMSHIRTEHSVDYQRIVSSGNSQEGLESQLYIIKNNYITCKFCDSISYETNNSYSLIDHLRKKHKIEKDKSAKICDVLRKDYFVESDTDMKRRCTSCNETILNKPLLLMSHLSEVHEINLLLKIKSVGFLTSLKWLWEYFTRSEKEEAKCNVCNQPFLLTKYTSSMVKHIKGKHGYINDVSENSQENNSCPYSITENNKIKCDICNKKFDLIFIANAYMKKHLAEEHNLNEDIARKLCKWVLEYFHISSLQTSKCNICENMFKISNSFNLMIHLKEAHQVRVSPEIIPTRLSSELSSLFNSDRCAENNALSSSYNQPTRNVDQSSDCDNYYDQIDNPSEIKRTRLSSEVSSLFNSDRCAENNVPSSSFNQPLKNVDQSFDCDHLYDQINNPSGMKTIRLSSELSSLFNSDRCAENNAPSTSYNQPPRNVDQSSDCDNHYVQVDNCSEIKTTKYKKWRKSRYY